MDIFINGKQGAGKTRAADQILHGQGLHPSDVLFIHDRRDTLNVRLLVEMLRASRVRAVVFDESLPNGAQLLIAVQAVKEFREQVNANVVAIYVQQVEPSVEAIAPVLKPLQPLTSDEVIQVINNREAYNPAVLALLNECNKQDFARGADREQSLLLWHAILAEEVGEFAKEVVESEAAGNDDLQILERAKAELIQVAAVAVQILKSFTKWN